MSSNDKIRKEIECVYSEVNKLVAKCISEEGSVVVLGDFNTKNARFGGSNDKCKLRLQLEENFQDLNNLHGFRIPSPTWQRGQSKSFIDHVFMSMTDLNAKIEVGDCLNGIGPRQYPDHRPVTLSIPLKTPRFLLSSLKRYDWSKVTELQWKEINLSLMTELQDQDEFFLTASAEELTNFMEKCFKRIRSKYLKPTWIWPNAQPFFSPELKALRKVVRRILSLLGMRTPSYSKLLRSLTRF